MLYYKAMIAKLTGTIDDILIGKVIIDVQGVGYLVFVTNGTLANVRTGAEKILYTYHAIRENASDLYGFETQEELDFFELLLSISGVGPKSALGILNASSIETLVEGIQSGDASQLTKVSGIGKKSAEKIVLELKDKLGTVATSGSNLSGSGEAIEALTALGYSAHDAREAIKNVDRSASTEDIIRQALKQLSE